MREIKFRAWSKKEKTMIYFSSDWAIDGEYSNLGFSIEHDEKNFFDSYKGAKEEAVIMQYTGLKDRNGKEIYEGDLVEYTRADNSTLTGSKTRHEATFAKGAFCCLVKVVSLGICPTYLNQYNEQSEIIGNIYKNPELLKEENK